MKHLLLCGALFIFLTGCDPCAYDTNDYHEAGRNVVTLRHEATCPDSLASYFIQIDGAYWTDSPGASSSGIQSRLPMRFHVLDGTHQIKVIPWRTDTQWGTVIFDPPLFDTQLDAGGDTTLTVPCQ